MAEKTYTISQIYSAMTSENEEFEALLAKEAIRQAAMVLCDITSDNDTAPMPDVNDIRTQAKDYAADMLPGFIQSVQTKIGQVHVEAKVTRTVNITVSF